MELFRFCFGFGAGMGIILGLSYLGDYLFGTGSFLMVLSCFVAWPVGLFTTIKIIDDD